MTSRDELINAIDSPTVQALARVFNMTPWRMDSSFSEQIVEVLAPKLISVRAQRAQVVTPELVKLVEDSRCFSCGNYPYQNCQRPGDKPCGREFEGGTRPALTSTECGEGK